MRTNLILLDIKKGVRAYINTSCSIKMICDLKINFRIRN